MNTESSACGERTAFVCDGSSSGSRGREDV